MVKVADVTIENVRGSIVLREESEHGAQWLRTNLPKHARFLNGEWVLHPERLRPELNFVAKVVATMMDAGLEVRQTPLYYHETRWLAGDGETVD